jgi:uncharacterized protein
MLTSCANLHAIANCPRDGRPSSRSPGALTRDSRRARSSARIAFLAALALLFARNPGRAADPCGDITQAVAQLHAGDEFQATTLLFSAARHGCEREARALLDHGAAIDAKDREGATALAKATQAGKTGLMKLLMESGANPNTRAIDGSTPLFYAAESDRGAALRLLLDYGADPNIPGHRGLRPLAAAAFNGSEDSVDPLLQRGADPNALDDDGEGAMVFTAGRAYAPIVARLIAAGVDANRRYAHGLTALMWAAGYDAAAGVEDVEATLKVLIDHGAALDLKDDRGETAADIARELGHEQAVALLAP